MYKMTNGKFSFNASTIFCIYNYLKIQLHPFIIVQQIVVSSLIHIKFLAIFLIDFLFRFIDFLFQVINICKLPSQFLSHSVGEILLMSWTEIYFTTAWFWRWWIDQFYNSSFWYFMEWLNFIVQSCKIFLPTDIINFLDF